MGKLWRFFGIIILCLPLLVNNVLGDESMVKTLEIGSPAPDFNLPGIDGHNYTLKNFSSADFLVVIFTANHCPTAQAYEDRIIQMVKDYKSKGVAFVAISPNDPQAVQLGELGYTDMGDSFDEMKIRAKDKGFNFPYLYDGDEEKAALAYGPVATPHVFIFDKGRKLRYVGRIDNSEKIGTATQHDARNALDALLAGKPVPVEKTRTFGCSIKWSNKREASRKAREDMDKEPVKLAMIDPSGVLALAKNDTKKLLLVNVWATWCAPCLIELPQLVTMYRMYRDREMDMVTISADSVERKDKVLEALTSKHSSCRNFLFSKEEYDALADALDKQWQGGFPYTLLIEPGGKIIYRHNGEIDPMAVKKAIVGYLGRYYK
jgi:peroxiredoxin